MPYDFAKEAEGHMHSKRIYRGNVFKEFERRLSDVGADCREINGHLRSIGYDFPETPEPKTLAEAVSMAVQPRPDPIAAGVCLGCYKAAALYARDLATALDAFTAWAETHGEPLE